MLTEIPAQKTSPNILKTKRPIGVQLPQNNNQNQNVTVIHGFKSKLGINPRPAVKVVDAMPEKHTKTGSLPSSVTIKPINNNKVNNHGKLGPPKPIATNAAIPKPNATITIPKMNNSYKTEHKVPTRIDASLAPPTSSTAAVASNTTNDSTHRPQKRIIPIKISDTVSVRANSIDKSSDSDVLSHESSETNRKKRSLSQESRANASPPKRASIDKGKKPNNPLNANFQHLINVCNKAKDDDEMKKICRNLEKYYHRAHPDYVNSEDFIDLVRGMASHIENKPKDMFIHLIQLLEEMKSRKVDNVTNGGANNKVATVQEAAATSTTPIINTEEQDKDAKREAKREKKIQKLSKGLQLLQSKIREYERAEVDWDDEANSSFVVTENLKKRAYDIYLKLCDLTGESRNAERSVKKPIKFNGTAYKEFDKKLETFVNEQKTFPDMFDVLRIMGHCNEKYKYRLDKSQQQAVGMFLCFF